MARAAIIAITFLLATAGTGSAQAPLPTTGGGAGIRAGHVTSTGETVPNPGESQSAGTTPMDRGIQRDDNKIQSSICKGC